MSDLFDVFLAILAVTLGVAILGATIALDIVIVRLLIFVTS